MREDSQAQKALREEVIGRFDDWADGEIQRLERRAKKAIDRGYPALAEAYKARADYVRTIMNDLKRAV